MASRRRLEYRGQFEAISEVSAAFGEDDAIVDAGKEVAGTDMGLRHESAVGVEDIEGAGLEGAGVEDLLFMGAQGSKIAGVDPALQRAGEAFDGLARDAKSLILKLARAVSSPRATEVGTLLEGMAAAWDEGMAALDEANAVDWGQRHPE